MGDFSICFSEHLTGHPIYLYWTANGVKPKAIDNVVVTHKQNNESIFSKKEKRILVVANVSAGKSTLINSLIGCRMNRTKTTACTDRLVSIHNKCFKDGLTHKDLNGSYSYFQKINEVNRDDIHEIAVSVSAMQPFFLSLCLLPLLQHY